MSWKHVALAVVLALGAANMSTPMAFGRGMSGGAHFVGGGFAGRGFAVRRGFPGHRFVINRRFVRPFRRKFIADSLWPYYASVPTDQDGAMDTAIYPANADFAAERIPVPICRRSEEIVRVPAEGGGTSQIKIINCPYGL